MKHWTRSNCESWRSMTSSQSTPVQRCYSSTTWPASISDDKTVTKAYQWFWITHETFQIPTKFEHGSYIAVPSRWAMEAGQDAAEAATHQPPRSSKTNAKNTQTISWHRCNESKSEQYIFWNQPPIRRLNGWAGWPHTHFFSLLNYVPSLASNKTFTDVQ